MDSGADTDTDTDTDVDTDTDCDSDSDADCGGADQICCCGECDAEEIICVVDDSDVHDDTCMALAVFADCGPQGYSDAVCDDIAEPEGLGVCELSYLPPLNGGNVCDEGDYGGFCCPAAYGGDEDGEAPDGGTICNGVDLAGLAPADTADEIIASGVGTCYCITEQEFQTCACGVPCASIPACAEGHHAVGYTTEDDLYAIVCYPDDY
jgi:hypothetical protein